MDAGMTMFNSDDNFGPVLGQVKAEMAVYGTVHTPSEGISVPDSVGEYDFFLDWSNLWRKRYISCHIESAGTVQNGDKVTNRYAALFREGNRSTALRGCTMALGILSALSCIILIHNAIAITGGLAFILFTAYRWIMPSSKAASTVNSIMSALSGSRSQDIQLKD